MKIVEVDWLDTMGNPGWHHNNTNFSPKDMLQHTIGYLIEHSKKQIVICASYGEYIKNYGDILQIPTGSIKKIKVLRRK